MQVKELVEGPGTVGVVVVDSNMEPAGETLREAVFDHIETLRPCCVEVIISAPEGLMVNVSAQVTIDGTTTKQAVRERFAVDLREYVESLVFKGTAVLLSRVAYLLLSIPGVQDYSALAINGAATNLTIPAGSVPVMGEVTVQ